MTKTIDFSTILASSVHDVKNSLTLLINKIDEISANTVDEQSKAELEQLQYHGKRISCHLIQLLVLYRINQTRYFTNITETAIKDFLNDALDLYFPLFAHKNISVTINCADELYWYIDRELVNGVVTNIMNNLYTYAKSAIEITARIENKSFILQIKDDGQGYPEEMLHVQSCHQQESFSFKSSSTGLGLYFSRIAAEMHQNNGRSGYTTIGNDGINGGGCFSIILP